MRRRLVWILGGIGGLLGLAVLSCGLWVGLRIATASSHGLPVRQGEVSLPGLGAQVSVRWDRWGVPHVTAASAEDLAAAQGWLHANDRLTQLELGRRLARGRMSEVLGPLTVEADRQMRTLRLGDVAEALWRSAGDESRRRLEAYAAGVNAWVDVHRDDLPPTLRILGVEPDRWTPRDSLLFIPLLANDVAFWHSRWEEMRFRWLALFGPERTRDLIGRPDLHFPEEILALARETAPHLNCTDPPPGGSQRSAGSNNWAVAGERTATGLPLTSGDPHLDLALPGMWYQVMLRSPELEVAGMSLPGLPGVVFGRNENLAWTYTITVLDDHDLFFERLDPSGDRVWRDGDGWTPIESRTETIRVRWGRDRRIDVRWTDRGSLLHAESGRGLPPRSLAWTAAAQPKDPLAALRHLARAERVEAIPGGLESYAGPALNLVAADRHGGLLMTVLGRVPDRRTGDGFLPSPGWDDEYGWAGLRLQTTNPTELRPEDGLLVTANADVRPAGYSLPFPAVFDVPHRALRARDLLEARHDWKPEDFAHLQEDDVDLYALEVLEILAGESWSGEAARALEHLDGWDGHMTGSEGALAGLLIRELGQAIFGDEAESCNLSLVTLARRDRLMRAIRGDMDPGWFDDLRTPQTTETRHQTLEAALVHAWSAAHQRWGEDPEAWRWEDIHQLRLEHPLGLVPGLGDWVNRGPFPVPGSGTTLHSFDGPWMDGEVQVSYGASARWIADLSRLDGDRVLVPAGQAGHPEDPHYDDQLPLFLEGRLRPVAWTEGAIEAATVTRLTLRPGASR